MKPAPQPMTSPLPTPHASILQITPYKGGKSAVEGKSRVIKLSSNENPYGPSPKAVEAIRKSESLLARYPDGSYAALRKAIADVHGLDAERIVCGAGSDELIGLLVHAYAGEGDEILYPRHGFLMYKIYAQSNGATPVTAPEKNLRTDVDALLAKVSPRTRMVFLANPNNPTGSYITRAEMKRLRDGLRGDILLVVDGAYAEYPEDAEYSCGMELAKTTENTVALRTFSKIYGLAALRLGWGYFPEAVADVLNRVRAPFNVSAIAAAAGIAAVEDTAYTAKSRALNNASRKWTADTLCTLGLNVHPSVGNFLLVEFPEGEKNAEAANIFLQNEGIIVRDVVAYGLPQALRITIGTEEECKAVADALARFMG